MNYLERCVQAVSSIDPTELQDRRLSPQIGEARSNSSMYALGQIAVNDRPMYVGIKATRNARLHTATARLVEEIPQITALCDRTNYFDTMVPNFVGLLEVAGSGTEVTLTEDASRGGTRSVASTSISQHTRIALSRAFPEFNRPLLQTDANHYVAFDVSDGETTPVERLLDFTPSPFMVDLPGITDYTRQTRSQLASGLRVQIDIGSPLGQDILGITYS